MSIQSQVSAFAIRRAALLAFSFQLIPTFFARTLSPPISNAIIVDGSLLKPPQWKFLEEHAFTGYDNDANMVKIAILNLYLHQLEKAHIELRNPLTTGFGGVYPGPAL